ncbi:hypothetical protein BD289DRAFT_440795 [Coniella lustricola]|uniref:Uncharacterized protein n=1 Tax=Coniella lustricola TaxID=2025994 RepID=A0A2T3A074_9PEZI|nr:hypothetical protein BD289DRAFT_440795 [Coniella lustricola]
MSLAYFAHLQSGRTQEDGRSAQSHASRKGGQQAHRQGWWSEQKPEANWKLDCQCCIRGGTLLVPLLSSIFGALGSRGGSTRHTASGDDGSRAATAEMRLILVLETKQAGKYSHDPLQIIVCIISRDTLDGLVVLLLTERQPKADREHRDLARVVRLQVDELYLHALCSLLSLSLFLPLAFLHSACVPTDVSSIRR